MNLQSMGTHSTVTCDNLLHIGASSPLISFCSYIVFFFLLGVPATKRYYGLLTMGELLAGMHHIRVRYDARYLAQC